MHSATLDYCNTTSCSRSKSSFTYLGSLKCSYSRNGMQYGLHCAVSTWCGAAHVTSLQNCSTSRIRWNISGEWPDHTSSQTIKHSSIQTAVNDSLVWGLFRLTPIRNDYTGMLLTSASNIVHKGCRPSVQLYKSYYLILQGEVLGITRFGLAKMKESVLMLASVSISLLL